jgi:acetoacetyl-CoA reductase
MKSLHDAVVVVTGSARGIGRSIAVAAAARGAKVVVNSRAERNLAEVVAEIEEESGQVLGVAADLRDAEQVESLMDQVVRKWQRLDVLVNNAAGVFFSAAEEISPNGWRAVVDTNLTTTFLCSRAAFPHFLRQGGGRIINISSVAADHPHPGGAHYAAAKAGINSLTKTLAVEWGKHNIQVNGVAPGAVLTASSRFVDDSERARVEEALPEGRIAGPDEIAEVVLALASCETTYLNGETVRIDGAHLSPLQRSRVQTTRHARG